MNAKCAVLRERRLSGLPSVIPAMTIWKGQNDGDNKGQRLPGSVWPALRAPGRQADIAQEDF